MKRRIGIVIFLSVFLIGAVTAVVWGRFSEQLSGGAQDVLYSYLEAIPGEASVAAVGFAMERGAFTAEMGRPILHAPVEEYRTSPVLYGGDVIRVPEESGRFPLPAQELWCVTLKGEGRTADYYFLARHDDLYGETWVLYQARNGLEAFQSTGCNP